MNDMNEKEGSRIVSSAGNIKVAPLAPCTRWVRGSGTAWHPTTFPFRTHNQHHHSGLEKITESGHCERDVNAQGIPKQ